MQHCRAGAPGRARTRRCWRAAAKLQRSGKPQTVLTRMSRTSRSPRAQGRPGLLRPAQPARAPQPLVRTVAERLAAGRFATAEPDLFGRFGGERNRGQPRALVRPVAKGLARAAPARAPEIPLAGFDANAVGLFLRRYRFGHSV